MDILPEGVLVSYVGNSDHIAVGDRGRVVSAERGSCHVAWKTGQSDGEILFHINDDLVAEARRPAEALDDSLEIGSLVTLSVREVMDDGGTVALLNALNDEGHLTTFAAVADEAIELIARRIHEDPSFQEVLARLDPDEGDQLIALATATIVRDAFGAE